MKYFLIYFLISITFIGCATSSKINNIALGMSKQETIEKLGLPVSVSAQNGVEYLNYALSETDDDAFYGRTTRYYVRIMDNKVESFGRTGDFDSTKTPTIKIESEIKTENKSSRDTATATIQNSEPENGNYKKLKELKKMKDDGIIDSAEYEKTKAKFLKDWSSN